MTQTILLKRSFCEPRKRSHVLETIFLYISNAIVVSIILNLSLSTCGVCGQTNSFNLRQNIEENNERVLQRFPLFGGGGETEITSWVYVANIENKSFHHLNHLKWYPKVEVTLEGENMDAVKVKGNFKYYLNGVKKFFNRSCEIKRGKKSCMLSGPLIPSEHKYGEKGTDYAMFTLFSVITEDASAGLEYDKTLNMVDPEVDLFNPLGPMMTYEPTVPTDFQTNDGNNTEVFITLIQDSSTCAAMDKCKKGWYPGVIVTVATNPPGYEAGTEVKGSIERPGRALIRRTCTVPEGANRCFFKSAKSPNEGNGGYDATFISIDDIIPNPDSPNPSYAMEKNLVPVTITVKSPTY